MDQFANGPPWDEALGERAKKYLLKYFKNYSGLTAAFPCLRDEYPWGEGRPDVADSRIPAKNSTEYHGLESHARQYHSAAMYEEAAHHWILAAWVRYIDKETHGFIDAGHDNAIAFCLNNVRYNEAMEIWSKAAGRKSLPKAESFGLTEKLVDRLETQGAAALHAAYRAVVKDR